MNKMKGLLIKDFAQLRGYKRNIIIMMVLYMFAMIPISLEEGFDTMSQTMIILVFGVIGITTFNYDETSKTDRYLLTMPLTKNEIVLEKYILTVVTTIIGTVVTLLFGCLIKLILTQTVAGFGNLWVSAVMGTFFVTILISFQIPCIYRWGAEKGRLQAMILMSVSVGILAVISSIWGNEFINQFHQNQTPIVLYVVVPLILILISALFYFISYRISLVQFHKREV